MKKKLFSILMPCFNSEKYIAEALKSVQRQEFKDYEIVCLDDGSKDRTYSILKKEKHSFGGRMRLFKTSHKGVAAARNFLLRKAKGEYIVFLDSDDLMTGGVLSELSETTRLQHPDCIIGKFDCFAEEGVNPIKCENFEKEIFCGATQAEVLENVFNLRLVMAVCRFVVKRQIVEKSKVFFNESIVHEDEEWATKILLYCHKFSSIEKPLFNYRKHKGSITTQTTIFNYLSKLQVAQELLKFSENFDGYQKTHILRKAYRLCKEIYYTLMEDVGDKER